MRAHDQELVLSISDDGVGFDPSATAPREDCFGLDGMAERARNAGGTLISVFAVIDDGKPIRRGPAVVLVDYEATQRRYVVSVVETGASVI